LISRFFIDRPIFATVLSIVITLAGGIALFALPIALYPPISPPTVQVDCNYPGASAKDVSETVATPIEQQVNGVENMLYMSSQCTNDGSYNLTVTFKHGVNLNMAQVLVQNRVSLAVPLLPDVIKQTGVNVKKKAPDILMAIAINSPGSVYDQLYLSNYATLQVKDELARLPGVSDVSMLGQRDYSMRIWVDPDKLAARNMQAGDVVKALREQNLQVATGQIGQQPAPAGQERQIPLSTLGRLSEVEQFERVIVKMGAEGRTVRVRDVARVELGAKNQDMTCMVNGKPSVSLAIFQLPDANALDTAVIVRAKMEELAKDFPTGVAYEVRYDTTPFISESINEVFKTLREAVMLVALVVLLFLQNWRSAVIPLIAVPVAIVGTFAAMAALGFSLNNLTLFGLVLAIGIVVDDAIVVVEAVEHHIEHGMSPRDATVRAMEEVSGPVIAIGLVLTAVFVPCAFITGIVGQFFRQFALTIISAFNSLTLSPALTALLLKSRLPGQRTTALPRIAYAALGGYLGYILLAPPMATLLAKLLATPILASQTLPLSQNLSWLGDHANRVIQWGSISLGAAAGACVFWLVGTWIDRLLSGFFQLFNAGFRIGTTVYGVIVGGLLRVSLLVLIGYGGLLFLTYHEFNHTAKGFIPSQDMGYLLINAQLPDAASAERTRAVMDKIERIARDTPGIKHTQTMAGQSILLSANGSNFGSMFCILDSFENRREPEVRLVHGTKKIFSLDGPSIQKELGQRFAAEVPEAMLTVLGPPPVRGVGRAGGFKLMVEDLGDVGPKNLQTQTEALVAAARTDDRHRFMSMTSVFRANVPSLFVDVDRTEALIRKVATRDLFDTLRIYLGSLYVNDFNLFGRTWQVVVQAEPRYRNHIDDARRLKVRNSDGNMVPLGTVATVTEIDGPMVLTRYNMHPAAPINGAAAPGTSSGEAISGLEELAGTVLQQSMGVEWTELAFLEIQAGNTAMYIFAIAVLMVFLVLAAQYESWSLPLAIILVVPMCLLSAVKGVQFAKQDINIFTQIGFVVLIGLASKNAILIVEFAKQRREEGETARQAALDACKLRLRPIVMTSLAFILGVVPLIVSHGAGAEMRQTLGTTVFSGMLGVTVFGIFLTPVFFYVIDVLSRAKVFHSAFVTQFNSIVLGALSLRLLRNVAGRIIRNRNSTTKPKPPRVFELETADDGELIEQK
jgi:multidrug efflux pump